MLAHHPHTPRTARSDVRSPVLASLSVLVVLALSAFVGSARRGDAAAAGDTPASSSAAVAAGATAAGPSTSPSPPAPTTTAAPAVAGLGAPLGLGSAGSDVRRVQERLATLGFGVGPADGVLGPLTEQALWAFHKLVLGTPAAELEARRGGQLVDEAVWQRMNEPIEVRPRRPHGRGTHVEISLPLQVLAVFVDDRPALVAHVSSGELDEDGRPAEWCGQVSYDIAADGTRLPERVVRHECGVSLTPGGVFRVEREVAGYRQGPLGGMLDPVYFNYGIAVHGAAEIPLRPASHGCVRLHADLSATFASLVSVGDRVLVWGHDGREPEDYSDEEMLPVFNWAAP